ncbi:MAG: hypothetical protein JO252_03810 [Planctomycetaceae bacterium]|nr:hypothetical protein [Planctomycetaceae bacterium]
MPIPLGLPAWIGHAPSSGHDPAPGPIMSPPDLAAIDHMLAGLSDRIAGEHPRTAWSALADQTAAGNLDPAESSPSHREFLVQAERVLTSGPDAVAGLPPRVELLDWAHHVDLCRLGVVPHPPHPKNGRTDPDEFLSNSQFETTAVHQGNDVDLVVQVGQQEVEHSYGELNAQAATGRLMRGAYLLAVRSTFDEQGAGATPFDNPPDIVPGSDREPSSPKILPRATRDPEPPATIEALAETAAGSGGEVPPPQGAGLIADVLPFDRASFEQAVEHFFDGFEDLASGPARWHGSPGPIRALLMLVVATTAEATWRRLRRTSDHAEAEHERGLKEPMVLPAFPELPGSWSMRA